MGGDFDVHAFRVKAAVEDTFKLTMKGSKGSAQGSKQFKAGDELFNTHQTDSSRIDDMQSLHEVLDSSPHLEWWIVGPQPGQGMYNGAWRKWSQFGEPDEVLEVTIETEKSQITDTYIIQLKGISFGSIKLQEPDTIVQVSATVIEEGLLLVKAMGISGEERASLQWRVGEEGGAEGQAAALHAELAKALSVSGSSLHIVLPNGSRLRDEPSGASLQELLGVRP